MLGSIHRVLLQELLTKRTQSLLKRWTNLAEQCSIAQTFNHMSEFNFWTRDCRYMELHFAIKAHQILNVLPVAVHELEGGSVAST